MSSRTDWKDGLPDLVEQSYDSHDDAFMAVIEAIPPGQSFSVNDVRRRLDALEIPNTKRGGLFSKARKAGLIERAGGSSWGRYYLDAEPSTGRSAKNARVARYRRCKDDTEHAGGTP